MSAKKIKNVEKRTVSTDALETLGTIIDNNAGRDAIHLAVEPVLAGEVLYAGQHIGIINGIATTKAKKKLGIVDPFIVGPIVTGSKFWLIVYPRQITSLRHVWSHPDFPEKIEEPVVAVVKSIKKKVLPVISDDTTKVYDEIEALYIAEEWLKNFAAKIPLDYDKLMFAAEDYQNTGDRVSYGSLLEGEYVPPEFWDHYEIVKKEKVKDRGNFFSCSC